MPTLKDTFIRLIGVEKGMALGGHTGTKGI